MMRATDPQYPPAGVFQASSESTQVLNANPLITEADPADFPARIQTLFDSCQTWVSRVGNPDLQYHRIRHSHDLDRLLERVGDHNVIKNLIDSNWTRSLLLTRVVVEFITTNILDQRFFIGYRQEVDQRLQDAKIWVRQAATAVARSEILEDIARLIKSFVSNGDFRAFLRWRCEETSREFIGVFGPLMMINVNVEEARSSLTNIIIEAADLSLKMFSLPVEWPCQFPHTGDTFNAHTMVNRDALLTGNALELQRQSVRVQLAFTPNVVSRGMPRDSIVAIAIHTANVLLMR
ncbi:MAG: hypothetical protein M1817_002370 [Caeruleum heppii]|nr:MAG: hypothetical protein M1817_002370 [Caeruleum heppii]